MAEKQFQKNDVIFHQGDEVGTPEFREKLHSLPVPAIQYLQERKECCLQEVYWRNKQ